MDTGLASCRRKSESFISLSKLNQNDNEDNGNKPLVLNAVEKHRKCRAREHVSCSLSKINRLQEDGLEKRDVWEQGQYTHRYNLQICAHL